MSYTPFLKFNLLVLVFIFLLTIAIAGDVVVDVGDVYTEKDNELFLSLKNTEAGGHDYRLVSAGSSGGIGAGKFAVYDATVGSARLTIDTNGKVGIGTTSPEATLHLARGEIQFPDGSRQIEGARMVSRGLLRVGDANEDGVISYADTKRIAEFKAGLSVTCPLSECDVDGDGVVTIIDSLKLSQLLHGQIVPTAAQLALQVGSNGNVGIGTTSPEAKLHLYAAGSIGSIIERQSSDTGGPEFVLHKRRLGIVSSGDDIGIIEFEGYDGANYIRAAQIEAEVDGTPGTNDMPGRLVFSTTPDGASSATERMRITNAGSVGIGTSPATGNKLDVSGKIHATEDICTDLSGGKCLSTVSGAISETDPQVGTLTSSKWCVANSGGTAIDCSQNAPLTSETDPQVGTITDGKWCKANAGVVKCDQDTPAGDSDWTISGTDMYSGVSGKVGIGAATPKTKLDVAGEVKFGNTGLTCNSDAAGAIRYNSGSKVMEFCDGSAWNLFSGGTTPTPPPAAKTKVQCSVDGSATDTSTTACSQPTCDEVSQNTYDDCSGEASCSTDGYMYVNDVKLEGTIATGGSVTPSVQVYCYNSGTQWAIYFYGGTSWTQKCSGSCTGSGLEWKSCPTFNLPSSSGTYYLRGITSWWDTITAACVTTTYGDHDDIKIQI